MAKCQSRTQFPPNPRSGVIPSGAAFQAERGISRELKAVVLGYFRVVLQRERVYEGLEGAPS